MSRLESKFPGQFRVELIQDPEETGRLECTVYFNKTRVPLDKEGGIVLHSKANGHGFPDEDWKAFDQRVH